MISKSNKILGYCCEDLSLIENYDKAVNDTTQMWECHHRLEIQDGILVNTATDLIRKNLYWHRPASELIFLPRRVHIGMHTKARCSGVHKPPEQCKKISESLKGNKPWNKGKHGCQTAWNKGNHLNIETRQKISKNGTKGKHRVYDNLEHTKYHYE